MEDTCAILGKRQCDDHPHAQRKRRLESRQLLLKTSAGMAARMGHFKLAGSPKRKNYRPRRKLQYSEAPTESPSKSHAILCVCDNTGLAKIYL